MISYNTNYTTKIELEFFLKKNNIVDSNNILLQVFTGICEKTYITNLIRTIKTLLPNINIIGSTTSGEILEDRVSDNQTVLSFSIFEKTKVEVHRVNMKASSNLMAQSIIKKINNDKEARVVIAFSNGLTTNGEIFLETFNQLLPNTIVAGGLAGDNAKFEETYVFTDDGLCGGSVCAVLYGEDLVINTSYSFGWQSIGKEFLVTSANENKVYKINDYTPAELYAKYLGENIQKQLPTTGIEFPLIIERNGKRIARAVVGAEKDGSLIFAGNVRTGDRVWLGYGDTENILKNGSKVYDSIVESPVESIFIYSCMARKALLGDSILTEILPLQKIAPTSGFFTYGEYFHTIGDIETNNQLLNETMTVLALSENNVKIDSIEEIEYSIHSPKVQTVEALSHLISQTTKELNDLNKELEERVVEEVKKNQFKDQQILHQAKHAQMGEMMSMIAHQWRQPLSAISSTAISIILKAKLNKLDNDTAQELSTKISEYSQHLSYTIDDFRNFFKVNKEKKEITYTELVESVLNIVEASIVNKNIKITLNLESDNIIHTYPNELKQVVLNLIKNAEEVLIENKIHIPEIIIKSEANKLSICDNGGGVDKSIVDKIFNPYFSTKIKKNGTGLGLYMSKTIVEEHCNGKLNVYNSKVNGGATFEIEL